MNWEQVKHRHIGGLSLEISRTVPDPNENDWVLIRIYDLAPKQPLKLFEALYPKLGWPSSWSSTLRQVIQLMEMVWLYIPAHIRHRVTKAEIFDRLPLNLHPLMEFMLTHYYSVLKCEHGYDAGYPCEFHNAEFLDPSLFPPQLVPENFGNSRCLLSWSYGKESQTAAQVLDFLKIPYDTFRILDRADVPLLELRTAQEWYEDYPNYQCLLGDIRRLWHFQSLSRMWVPYHQIDTTQSKFSSIGISMAWNMGFTQRLLAMLYMAINGYQTLFAGIEYERHQIHRVPKGVYLSRECRHNQFFYNYFMNWGHTDFKIFSPIVNFTQGACMRLLVDREITFNSCFASRGDDSHWCGRCDKCIRIKRLYQVMGSELHKDASHYQSVAPFLLHMRQGEQVSALSDYEIKVIKPSESKPVFPEMENIHGPHFFNKLFSNHVLNVWSPETIRALAYEFGFVVQHDRNFDGAFDFRTPNPNWKL